MKNILLFISFLFALASCHFKNKDADLIIHNARIYTVDDAFSIQEAMAIKDGKIIAIGAEREILNEYKAKETIDCGKRCIYPGFIDAHCHFLAYGRTLQEVNLDSTLSFADVVDRVKKFKPGNSRNWIIGRGWDQNDWQVQEFPNRAILDSLFPEIPVVLKRIDGHAMLVNQKALTLAGILPNTSVQGGQINYASGILVDKAMDFIDKVLPSYSKEDDTKALLEAQANCFAVGLTTIDDAGLNKTDVDLIKELQNEGKLKMRIYAMISDTPENFDYYLSHGIDTTNRLTVRSFKFYADGALGSRGACLLAPYSDVLPGNAYGMLLDSIHHFRKRAYDLHAKGFQMCTHAIGDSANRVMLDIYREVEGEDADLRWRIEHAQVVHHDDISKFGQYNIIPSVQPTHATSDMPWAINRLGHNRLKRAYVYRELKDQLGMLPLGTDFPIEGISPLRTFYAAVVRKDTNGQPAEGFQMDNALTREDAMRGITIWPAIANFEENKKGSLEVGKFADFVMLDQDLLKCSDEGLLKANVLLTVSNGEIVMKK